jgi:hypothetical protein
MRNCDRAACGAEAGFETARRQGERSNTSQAVQAWYPTDRSATNPRP